MKRIAFALVLSSFFGMPDRGHAAGDSLIRSVEGRWGLAGVASCEGNAQTIRFSEDGETMLLSLRKPVESPMGWEQFFEYRVTGQAGNAIRMELVGETRLTEAGEPVAWDLVLLGRDRFCWHRSDWDVGACTPQEHRCESRASWIVDLLRATTAEAIHMLAQNRFEEASHMFELPDSLEPSEAETERARIARSLRILVSELGAPLRAVETDQNVERPALIEISVGGLGQVVARDLSPYRFLLFSTEYARLGSGYFRLQLQESGAIAGMTFSLGPEHRGRVAEIGERLLREAAP